MLAMIQSIVGNEDKEIRMITGVFLLVLLSLILVMVYITNEDTQSKPSYPVVKPEYFLVAGYERTFVRFITPSGDVCYSGPGGTSCLKGGE